MIPETIKPNEIGKATLFSMSKYDFLYLNYLPTYLHKMFAHISK